jgi:SAM-dependent methyltransferase
MSAAENPPLCHDCGSAKLKLAAGYERAWRVTSDCKPWPPGGHLALCNDCRLVQTITNEKWKKDCEEIYRGYTIYQQSCGAEQPVFDSSGASQSRSDVILQKLVAKAQIPDTGRWLDIGCGNGALLRACSRAFPSGWTFFGSEFDDKYRELVEKIPHFQGLFTGPLEEIPGHYDVISLVHVIEHIPGPSHFLSRLKTKLKPNGLLLLEVPDCRSNPFSIMTADHCSHFSVAMLSRVASGAGCEVLHAGSDWVPKEISVLARHSSAVERPTLKTDSRNESEQVFGGWDLLQEVAKKFTKLSQESEVGIFGTSIAATWLDAETGRVAKFFVDEDAQRVGRQHLGRAILSPEQVPKSAIIYLALAPLIAQRVAERLRPRFPQVRFEVP